MSKRIVIGNWKENPTSKKEAEKIFKQISKGKWKGVEVVACPPSIYIEALRKISKRIILGAQNIFYENSGAFTGKIGGSMLYELGARYTIIGHSERRSLGENNNDINKKIKNAVYNGLVPILCVGENFRDNEHKYLAFIKEQVESALEGVSKTTLDKIIIAYEPVWAIGSSATREATPSEFLEISIFLKRILSDKFGIKSVGGVRILYGGSVHPENSLGFLIEGKADGFLVGRDSLNPKKFLEIINNTENAKY